MENLCMNELRFVRVPPSLAYGSRTRTNREPAAVWPGPYLVDSTFVPSRPLGVPRNATLIYMVRANSVLPIRDANQEALNSPHPAAKLMMGDNQDAATQLKIFIVLLVALGLLALKVTGRLDRFFPQKPGSAGASARRRKSKTTGVGAQAAGVEAGPASGGRRRKGATEQQRR